MDALRKAEQQKQQAAAAGAGTPETPGAGLALEPMATPPDGAETPIPPAAKSGASRLPELPSRLEELDEQFMAHAAEAKAAARAAPARGAPAPEPPAAADARPAPAARQPAGLSLAPDGDGEASRAAARQVFSAKQPRERGRRSFAIAAGLATLLAVAGIGGYFWWQLQPRSSLVVPPAPGRPAPSAAAPAPVAAAPTPPAATVPPAPTFAPPVAPSATSPPGPEGEDEEAPPPPRRAEKPPAPPPAATQPRKEAPIRISSAPRKPNPLFEQAFQAFNEGNADLAQAAWQKILQADPKNADALHGLAAVAQRRGQPERAADYYLRAIEADPKDAHALSGLIALRGQADPQQTESRLKTLLAEQPDSPPLNFVLGNLLARDGRWADAQQAYFKAHVADPGNPDYLFNLAVSLDQLRQARLAAQYYNQAISAASQRPAGFDPALAATRLKALQP